METKTEKIYLGNYTATCTSTIYSPTDQIVTCNVTNSEDDFRAKFEYEVYRGLVTKADATLSKELLTEVSPSDDESRENIERYMDWMNRFNKDKVKVTIAPFSDKERELWIKAAED